MGSGFVKLFRSITEWEWYQDANTMRVFLHLLLHANYKPKKWQGITIEAGQFITSRDKLAVDLKLSVQQIRTSLNKLKSTSEITIKTTNRFTVITINKWQQYQGHEETKSDVNEDYQPTEQPASQPTDNQQITTTKKDKNEKEEKKKDICLKTNEVFDHWVMRMGKTKAAKLTTGRAKAIKARMAEGYTVEDLKRAVDGCAKSKHHMGMNDQGTVYDDLTLICRSGEKVEQFMNNVSKVVPINPQGRGHEESQRDHLQTKPGYMLSPDEKRRKLEQQLEALQQSGIEDYF